MLTPKEEAFLVYWEANRGRRKRLSYQLLVGLPVGLLIGAGIMVNFYSGWYKRAEMVSNSRFNPVVLYLAVGAIAIFFAIFSKKFQWDQYDQRYQELMFKKQHPKNNQTENNNSQNSNEKQSNEI